MEKNVKRRNTPIKCDIRLIRSYTNVFMGLNEISARTKTSQDILDICKKHNVNINDKYSEEYTLLSCAIFSNYTKLSLILINCEKVDVNKTYNNYGPITLATRYKNNIILDQLLLRKDINPRHKWKKEAICPLHFAIVNKNKNAVNTLIKYTNSIEKKKVFENTCIAYLELLTLYEDRTDNDNINNHPCYTKTLLEFYYNTIKFVVKNGALVSNNFLCSKPHLKVLFGDWASWLPEWTITTHVNYPQDFKESVLDWILVCKRFNIYKDIRIEIIKFMAILYKKNI